jgi:GDP-4-dehydro-6-deoxy-D-mannose reductase
MAVWLVTGATGFLGRHVLDALASDVAGRSPYDAEVEVVVLGRHRPASWPEHRFIEADLNDPDGLRESLRTIAPEFVIHTAGKTPPAGDDELYRANFWSTTHLLGALRAMGKPMRVVLAGSAAELGPVDAADLPVGEDYAADPVDAYGRSKLLATRSGLAERPPLQVVAARIFNVIGPGLPPTQAFGAFAARLAEPGPDPLDLPVGSLTPRRDFIDVRDVARALIALARQGRAGRIFHIGTGSSRSIVEGLRHLVTASGRSVVFRDDPALLRRPGPSDSRAAIGRIAAETGWVPRISFEESLDDLWCEVRGRQAVNPWSGTAVAGSTAWRLPLTA